MPSAQTQEALVLANAMRARRAKARREVYALSHKEGRHVLADMLDDPPAWIRSETLGRFLEWPRRLGPAVAHRLLIKSGAGASTVIRVGDLTERQREVLAATLRADDGAESRMCNGCGRTLPYWNFPRNGASGGWRDSLGARRRGCCQACENRRQRAKYEKLLTGIEDDPGDWPAQPPAPGILPAEPFAQWLEHKLKLFKVGHAGGIDEFARTLGTSERKVRSFIQREHLTAHLSTVDRILTREGSTGLWELYGDLLYPDLVKEDAA